VIRLGSSTGSDADTESDPGKSLSYAIEETISLLRLSEGAGSLASVTDKRMA